MSAEASASHVPGRAVVRGRDLARRCAGSPGARGAAMTETVAGPGPAWTDDAIRWHAARLYRSAFGMTRNAADAEDLVQETFARAFAARGQLLAGVKGLGYRQIADLTGVSIGTVKSSLHRGRCQLRARLAGLRPGRDQ